MRWDEDLEAVVCDSCERAWAPIVMTLAEVNRSALIRAVVIGRGNFTAVGKIVGETRHYIRRKCEIYDLRYGEDLIVPYASHGPNSEELTTYDSNRRRNLVRR